MCATKSIPNVENLDLLQWMAGILEGEGSFLLCQRRISIVLCMTDADIVQRMALLWGVAYFSVSKRKDHHKVPYVCRASGTRAAYLMQQIYPYMGARRRSQIRHCLDFVEEASRRRSSGETARKKKVANEDLLHAWNSKEPSESFRAFARRLGVANRNSMKTRLETLTGGGAGASAELRLREEEAPKSLAWIAGLLEGEGCFDCNRRNNTVCVTLNMTDVDVVNDFAAITSAFLWKEAPRRNGWKPSFIARVQGVKAAQLMRAVLPYMGQRRSVRIEDCLAYFDGVLLARKVREEAKAARLPLPAFKQRWLSRAEGESLLKIAQEFGVHPDSLRKQLLKLGVYESPIYKYTQNTTSTCSICGSAFEHLAHKAAMYCSRKCSGQAAAIRLRAGAGQVSRKRPAKHAIAGEVTGTRPGKLLPQEAICVRWRSRKPEDSLRVVAREFCVNHETLRKRLIAWGVY
ncbi:hypothetical protein F6X40_10945 [Paraburkholderia sp. UCT31]|uniref:hypothetical protein n=1 Tax=Paraburkholderia sp. UCT31 TaxID=2615209 RepID=UPI001655BA2A|nr:hypothetical protein [Paraburkholderia sp. UCT31]MBC8737324.1 hypothetical protein [Paraburkholderia sp. UCT31]